MRVDVPALLSPLAREDPTEIPTLLQPMCTSQTPRQHGQRTASQRDRRGEPQSPRRDQDQQHPQSSHETPCLACCCKSTDRTSWPGLWGEGSAGERGCLLGRAGATQERGGCSSQLPQGGREPGSLALQAWVARGGNVFASGSEERRALVPQGQEKAWAWGHWPLSPSWSHRGTGAPSGQDAEAQPQGSHGLQSPPSSSPPPGSPLGDRWPLAGIQVHRRSLAEDLESPREPAALKAGRAQPPRR